jgi:DNA modification methylase
MKRANINLHLGDCMAAMAKMPDNAYDICITDPPYNLGYKYNIYDDNLTANEYKEWCSKWLNELKRICKHCVLISCGHQNIGMWYSIEQPRGMVCWHKPAAMGGGFSGICNWEPVLMYGKPMKQSSDYFKAAIIPDEKMNFHSCPKPVKWAEMQLDKYADSGAKVIDIFGGSFTTAIACHNLKFDLDLWELDPDYYEAGVKRFNEHTKQLQLY